MQLVPACDTVKTSPPTVIVPVRSEAPVFAVALKAAVPSPEPLAPLVTVSQEALLTAVHAHPAAAVTAMLPVPAADVSDWLVGLIEGSHGAENENWFETALAVEPPDPTADTRAS